MYSNYQNDNTCTYNTILFGTDMVMESLAVLVPLLQFSVAPFSAVRLFPARMRVELMQEGSLVWLSMIFTPLTVGVNDAGLATFTTATSPIKKELFQMMSFPGSLQVYLTPHGGPCEGGGDT